MKFDFESKGFNLRLHRDDNWTTSDSRILIVLETVPTNFLEAEEIDTKVIDHCVSYSLGIARGYGYKKQSPAFAIVNFNDYKHLHLSGAKKVEAVSYFRERLNKLIDELKPTGILFSGDASLVIENLRNPKEKNGWVHNYRDLPLVSTLDFAKLLANSGEYANLLGYWCRHLANLIIGKHPHSLAHIKPAKMPKVIIDTIPKFDKLMKLWDKAEVIAVDTETKNLSVLRNAILTIQFCFDSDKTKGFLVPFHHPHDDNTFTDADKKYITKVLAEKFSQGDKELVTFNGIFDLRVIRRQLNIPLIRHTVWEIQAGEHLLDENIAELSSVSHKAGSLAAVFCSYGNDSYISGTMEFSKGERSNTISISPKDEHFATYACLDVVSIMNIRDKQIEMASQQKLLGKSYKPYFMRHMRHMMSDTVHQLSHMKEAGSLLDRKYLRSLLRPDSELSKLVLDLEMQIAATPAGKAASKKIAAAEGIKTKSLFGSSSAPDLLRVSKPAHRNTLFLDVLGLDVVNKTKAGEPSIDKAFLDKYKNQNRVVALYADYQEAAKLLSTYVRGWEKTFQTSLDGEDSHLRADFSFFGVATGRLASSGPNFQNIPSRGKLAKIIKEMFIAADGTLLISFDFSAHEVRGWSQVSYDRELASVFAVGQKLRQTLIKNFVPALRGHKAPFDTAPKSIRKFVDKVNNILTELKTKGDVHIQNVFRFFGKWVAKSDPLRDAVKGVVFGTLYGKSPKSLGDDTKKGEFDKLKEELRTADAARVEELEQAFQELVDEDRSEQAQEIIDKMFEEFPDGHRWVERMTESAKNRFYVYSPIGRIRHLYAAMTKDKRILSRQVRRGLNAPIQGFASELAVKASRLTLLSFYDFAHKAKADTSAFRFSRMVHDASYYTVPYHLVIPFLHILQYETTYGITKAIKEDFNFELTIEPEIEMDIGTKETNTISWNWCLPSLVDILEQAVAEGIKNKILTESKEDIMEKILAPWKNPKIRKYLNKNYPMLGVDLESEIEELVNDL